MKYIIYKIQIKDYIYIGSTKNFTIRKAKHKQVCNSGKDFLVYRTIRENGGWDCCTMIPIKEIEVESKIQAHIEEEAIRIEYNAQMNARRAYRSEAIESELQKEYHQTPQYKEYQKEYRQTEGYKEYQKEYQQTSQYKEYQKEYQKEYHKEYQQTPEYKARKKEYRQTPEYKGRKKEYNKQYYLAKKAKLAESPEIKV